MYWYAIVLWLTLVDQSEPVAETYVPGMRRRADRRTKRVRQRRAADPGVVGGGGASSTPA